MKQNLVKNDQAVETVAVITTEDQDEDIKERWSNFPRKTGGVFITGKLL